MATEKYRFGTFLIIFRTSTKKYDFTLFSYVSGDQFTLLPYVFGQYSKTTCFIVSFDTFSGQRAAAPKCIILHCFSYMFDRFLEIDRFIDVFDTFWMCQWSSTKIGRGLKYDKVLL